MRRGNWRIYVYEECVHALQTGAWPKSKAAGIQLRRYPDYLLNAITYSQLYGFFLLSSEIERSHSRHFHHTIPKLCRT